MFGIDGGSMDIINEGIKQGRLPTLRRLLEEGASGTLWSVIPPVTAPAWASCLTGKNPGKHGIYSFFKRDNIHSIRPVNATDISGPTFPSILSASGKRVGLVNVPMTYPLPKLNGFVVSGMLTPPGKKYTYPPDLQETLDILGYRIEPDALYVPMEEQPYLTNLLDTAERRMEGLLYLMENFQWDVLVYFFRETDICSHVFWRFYDDQHPDNCSSNPMFRDAILRVYEKADKTLSEVTARVDEDTILLVMSDHGFCSQRKMVHINNWLVTQGFIHYKRRLSTSFKKMIYNLSPDSYWRILMKSKFMYRVASRYVRDKKAPRMILSVDDIDWNKTIAYVTVGSVSPYISFFISSPNQTIDSRTEGLHEKRREHLADRLESLMDEAGESLIEKIWKTEELYSGSYISGAPDLVAKLVSGHSGYSHLTMNPSIVTKNLPTQSGMHSLKGIIICSGPEIASVEGLEASIMDLAPTILHIMNVSTPADFDGNIIRNIFDPSSEIFDRKTKVKSRVPDQKDFGTKRHLREEDQDKVKLRLKSLGYM